MDNKNIVQGIIKINGKIIETYKYTEITEFKKDSFLTTPEGYYVLIKHQFVQATNFTIESFLEGDKRFCKITNEKGKVHQFDYSLMSNFSVFRQYIFAIGGFMFLTHNGILTEHFDKIVSICEKQFEVLEYKKQHEEITEFWNIVKYLFEDNQLKEGSEFIINKKGSFKIKGGNRTDTTYNNSNGDEILYIRMKSLYQFYKKEATKRNGEVLADDIIRKCFKSQEYFVGLVPTMRFLIGGASSAYAFNFTEMKEKGIMCLDKKVVSLDVSQDYNEITTNNQINKDLHVFFDIIKSLIDRELISKENYLLIRTEEYLKYRDKNIGIEKEIKFNNIFKDEFLFLRVAPLYPLYKRECMFNNKEFIPLKKLFSKIKKTPFHLGLIGSKKFSDGNVSSAYVFNYSAMKKQGFEF